MLHTYFGEFAFQCILRTGCLQSATLIAMRRPIFVRPLLDAEREVLEDGLRSSDAFVLRRCQLLLASSRGENAYAIARLLGCDPQTARTAIKRFNEGGIEEALRKHSSRPEMLLGAPGSSARTRACGRSLWPRR
jgi:hypothetical protein